MKLCILLICFFSVFISVRCGYAPFGSYVQPGSVLLPATRRGRYLANIIRRQAVDGTGIKFNKDADRINAESKRKVDVLSEELIPYIIAEQERRTTLYRRVMTAIQNGEKGITVAEMRGKPPLFIRRGLFYRCPSNLDIREPDGSGLMTCEKGIEPTSVLFDSCLSAEDRDLYVADNKYFFCNRHRTEGPDLPKNGTTVIGCAPVERTSLNYTYKMCTLEDSEDVVVHYRYYPDKSYKYVSELDPEQEICDHWNPCQVGYIFSLATPDQALLASELWHDYDILDVEKDEFIEDLPTDFLNEHYPPSTSYYASRRRIKIPNGYTFSQITCRKCNNPTEKCHFKNATHQVSRGWVIVDLKPRTNANCYKVQFISKHDKSKKSIDLLRAYPTDVIVEHQTYELTAGQTPDPINIPFKCPRCAIKRIVVRSHDFNIYNVQKTHFNVHIKRNDAKSQEGRIEINLEEMESKDFGSYFAVAKMSNGIEHNVLILNLKDTGESPLASGTATGSDSDNLDNHKAKLDHPPSEHEHSDENSISDANDNADEGSNDINSDDFVTDASNVHVSVSTNAHEEHASPEHVTPGESVTSDSHVTPGEHATSHTEVTPGEHAASNTEVTPGEHAASDTGVTPGEHAASKTDVTPDEHAASNTDVTPGEHAASDTEVTPGEHAASNTAETPDEHAASNTDVTPGEHAASDTVVTPGENAIPEENAEHPNAIPDENSATESNIRRHNKSK